MNRKIVVKIILLLGLTGLVVAGSFAWFADRSNPSISESNIKVAAAEGLVIKLAPDSPGRTNVNLNSIISDFELFELKQVSSADAHTFYAIDFGEGLTMTNPEFIRLPEVNNSSTQMISNGYIDYDFYLETEDQAKHIYIHRDTNFTGPSANAIRFSVSYSLNGLQTIIFGHDPENGITDEYTTKAIVKAGRFDYYNLDQSFWTNQLVRHVSYRDGGRSLSDDDPIDLNRILTTIPANTQLKVNIKIWLEGGDVDCNNTIASTFLDILIKFGSANTLRNAPNVFANNATGMIINLTNEMEWATTNTGATVWTPVTNVNMNFSGYRTVYVRYKEVPDVTPVSYATLVTFN